MKVIDLYDAANENGLLDEEVEDVLPFAEMFSFAERKIGVCVDAATTATRKIAHTLTIVSLYNQRV